jgi:hypothetical protein
MKRIFINADIRIAGAAYKKNMKKVEMILRHGRGHSEDDRDRFQGKRTTHGKNIPFW